MPLGVAAAKLGLSGNALRARCRRAPKTKLTDGRVVAQLGAGVIAVKLGASWRIRFPGEEAVLDAR